MNPPDDELTEMVDDATAQFLADLRQLGAGPAPAPSAELAAMLSGGPPGVATVVALPGPHRRPGLGGAGLARTAVVAAALLAALVLAGMNHALPPVAQQMVSRVVDVFTPLHIDPPDAPGIKHPGERRPTAPAGVAPLRTGTPSVGRLGDPDRRPPLDNAVPAVRPPARGSTPSAPRDAPTAGSTPARAVPPARATHAPVPAGGATPPPVADAQNQQGDQDGQPTESAEPTEPAEPSASADAHSARPAPAPKQTRQHPAHDGRGKSSGKSRQDHRAEH